MFEHLLSLSDKAAELEARLSLPEVVTSPELYRRVHREYLEIMPLVSAYRTLLSLQRELEEALAMTKDLSLEEELRAMAAEEAKEKSTAVRAQEEEIKILLLPKDECDERNVIIEIRAGAGGEEAALFAGDLYRMYRMYADSAGLALELLGCNETELGGFKEISFQLSGKDAYAKLKFESGVHRVQRVPVTESQGRIQTSTVTVAVLPEAEAVELEIPPGDIRIESMKSSGAGGQHINKTESAVRLLHLPSGMVITCQSQRSQIQNREFALRMLRTRLYDMKRREQQSRLDQERKSQIGSGDRSEKIRTYNFQQGRITDHRIGLSLYDMESFLSGNIEPMLTALMQADRAEKLKKQGQ